MKKLILFMMTMLMMACSAEPQTFDGGATVAEVPGEQQQALNPACSIVGKAGIADTTYITAVHILPTLDQGTKLEFTYLNTSTNVRDVSVVTFKDVHWSPFHTTNGTTWQAQSDAYPLRQLTQWGPGCELNFPNSYCMVMEGDYRVDSIHVNQLQNTEVFLSDRPVGPVSTTANPYLGRITAPFGYGITKFEGMGTSPINTLRVSAINAAHTGVQTKDWTFTTPGCP